jgi:hypothetical protein
VQCYVGRLCKTVLATPVETPKGSRHLGERDGSAVCKLLMDGLLGWSKKHGCRCCRCGVCVQLARKEWWLESAWLLEVSPGLEQMNPICRTLIYQCGQELGPSHGIGQPGNVSGDALEVLPGCPRDDGDEILQMLKTGLSRCDGQG